MTRLKCIHLFLAIDTNECILNPFICLHGGMCINTEGGYRCECADGWGGKNCDEGESVIIVTKLVTMDANGKYRKLLCYQYVHTEPLHLSSWYHL